MADSYWHNLLKRILKTTATSVDMEEDDFVDWWREVLEEAIDEISVDSTHLNYTLLGPVAFDAWDEGAPMRRTFFHFEEEEPDDFVVRNMVHGLREQILNAAPVQIGAYYVMTEIA
jgi:hypothetical protein